MPTFKQYLDALFKTRTTPAEAAAASAPAINNPVTFFDGIMGGVPSRTFTAPCDGYVVATANSAVSAAELTLQASANTAYKITGDFVSTGGGLGLFLPLKKGESFTVQMIGINQIQVRMYRLVGGGYRSLLEALQSGGQLCLRLKNFLTLGRSELERLNFKDTSLTLCRKEDRRSTNARLTLLRHSTVMHRSPLGTATTQGSSTTRFSLTQAASATEGFGAAARILRTIVRSCLAGKAIRFTFNFPSLLTRQQKCKGESLSSLVQVSLALPSLSANCEEVRHVA